MFKFIFLKLLRNRDRLSELSKSYRNLVFNLISKGDYSFKKESGH